MKSCKVCLDSILQDPLGSDDSYDAQHANSEDGAKVLVVGGSLFPLLI